MSETGSFRYRALDERGRRHAGVIDARTTEAVFDVLRLKGLSPLEIKAVPSSHRQHLNSSIGDREVSAFISDLAALLRAGADVRSALAIVAPTDSRKPLAQAIGRISDDILGGEPIDRAFAENLPARFAYVGALVAAGEAAGNLAGGLERAAEIIDGRLQAKDQLVSILAYPTFVLVSATIAFLVILLFVAPSLAPLASSPGASPGLAIRLLLSMSKFLKVHGTEIVVTLSGLALCGLVAGALGLWGPMIDRFLLEGPLKRLTAGLVYGGFAVGLGGILAAGAPMSDALRLAIRATRSPRAQRALQPVLNEVRQGHSLSESLGRVNGLPKSIHRLVVIGEHSGALGPMLLRAGRLEEKRAFRTIETAGRIIGPALIVGLGGLIGLLMAGLLSGVSGLGQSVLD